MKLIGSASDYLRFCRSAGSARSYDARTYLPAPIGGGHKDGFFRVEGVDYLDVAYYRNTTIGGILTYRVQYHASNTIPLERVVFAAAAASGRVHWPVVTPPRGQFDRVNNCVMVIGDDKYREY